MLNRRQFIWQTLLATGSVTRPHFAGAGNWYKKEVSLTILHTNDTHSRIEPFPMDGGKNEGLGGVAARAQLIRAIRREEENVLLFDAGDFFQGTPYFNLYKGEPEIKAMSAMQYDAVTIGNHDFDAGLENLALQLQRHASFPVIISNYNFSNTAMENKVIPYKIFKKGGLKIGVLGVGIELEGLVPQKLYNSTQYLNAIDKANEYAYKLKQEKCDLIICLSHLGYKYDDINKISDVELAKKTKYIDLIIGGHSHTLLEEPVIIKNKIGNNVIINQVGWAGIKLGRLDFVFKQTENKKLIKHNSIVVRKISD